MPLPELLARANSLLAGEAARYAESARERVRRPNKLGNVPEAQHYASELLAGVLAELSKRNSNHEHAGQVPILWCASPVNAGERASATIRVANDEAHPLEVSLYCSNFIADEGYEISSLAAGVAPRVATVEPASNIAFELELRVPMQTPPGTYSGLVQATSSKYVKAVLMVEVL